MLASVGTSLDVIRLWHLPVPDEGVDLVCRAETTVVALATTGIGMNVNRITTGLNSLEKVAK